MRPNKPKPYTKKTGYSGMASNNKINATQFIGQKTSNKAIKVFNNQLVQLQNLEKKINFSTEKIWKNPKKVKIIRMKFI